MGLVKMKRAAIFGVCCVPILAAGWMRQTSPTPITDPVADLKKRVANGQAKLEFEPKQGYLRSILTQLKIDPNSQVLVFSKTSLQTDHISPKTPRALYFNDEVYVGWIPGAPLIEIMSVDPKRGALFYTIENTKQAKVAFSTEGSDCFRCHGGRGFGSPAALFGRSVQTAPSGYSRVFAQTYNMTPSTPIRNRWGGWYVSGTHGKLRHMGNELSQGTDEKHSINTDRGANVTSLSRYFDVKPYLTPHSDIAALMVFEQQMEVQNLITRANQDALLILRGTNPEKASKETIANIENYSEGLVAGLLCQGEAKLTSPVKGTTAFAKTYSESGPKDSKGRSLYQLDLTTRILRYPCSPLIYSPSFDALQSPVKSFVYRRLGEILSGRDKSGGYAHLSAADRKNVLEILTETKPDFAKFLASSGTK
jgi:hypothetical protein